MSLLQAPEIHRRIGLTDSARLYIDPLLEPSQVGEVSIDLRLGPDFLVSLLTRKAAVELATLPRRGVSSYFRMTRREVGDKFVLYSGQIVLATSLEYVGMPNDVYADIISRSSYSRLGIHLNTMIQPGFRGCIPLELVNHGNNPVELVVGSRLVQARLFSVGTASGYQSGSSNRKYLGNVRPIVSRAQDDKDLAILSKMR
ncbi:deoxycytidine triphosphate deaminase [Mesorhizobium australicum WSM2073]|uniref:Deoxycytidine triphosphate deaminase n=1 Tax=Mesorhizobium australicum (strain HAMBI 3006 / LMG 24608 / WSM2073) TaxID=754035 RepID=L0KEH4_MESAW|nr:dCTP deaminase [Mesorhizobium australicum]AGB43406.1 deoxycytidine triphosphate deaminase [Mesorhizobium australicum WSM2073]